MTTLFVTSSGTEIGKTFVTVRLLAELEAAGVSARALKPVASGFDPANTQGSDTDLLVRAQGLAATRDNLDATSPWRFRAPLSPDMAAAHEGRAVPFAELIAFCRKERRAAVTLIEGIGGVMTPLTREHTVLDWIAALGTPALLVVGSYLGTLSHSLTAAAVLNARGVPLAGVVVSQSPTEPVPLAETLATLTCFLPGVPLAALPRGGTAAPLLPMLAPLLLADRRL